MIVVFANPHALSDIIFSSTHNFDGICIGMAILSRMSEAHLGFTGLNESDYDWSTEVPS